MATIESPCMGCKNRTTYCHSTCKVYLEYYQKCRKENEERQLQNRLLGYRVDDIRRIQKRYGRKGR